MPTNDKQRKRSERLQVMLDIDELKVIETWRFMYRMPSRAAAIRALIREGLRATMKAEELEALDPSELPDPIRSDRIAIVD